MISWNEEYILGIKHIDEQHEKLFEIAGRAFELLKNKFITDKYNKIIEIIEELKDYTVYHFKTEEEYMMSIGYRRYFSHKVAHNDFIEKVNNVNLKAIDQNQDEYILGILEFVVKWIDQHIKEEDKQIAAV